MADIEHVQLLEDEAHNKTDVDIMTNNDITIYFGNGKVYQVLRQDLDGTREDITEQWLKDHPQ